MCSVWCRLANDFHLYPFRQCEITSLTSFSAYRYLLDILICLPNYQLCSYLFQGRSRENFPVDRFLLNFYCSQVMSGLCQKCEKIWDSPTSCSEIIVCGNYPDFEKLVHVIQHGLQRFSLNYFITGPLRALSLVDRCV